MTPNYVYSQLELAQQIEDRARSHEAFLATKQPSYADRERAKALANEDRVIAELIRQTVFVQVVEVKG
jgi:hypothetical protein